MKNSLLILTLAALCASIQPAAAQTRTPISKMPYTIKKAGHYYLTKSLATTERDGITVLLLTNEVGSADLGNAIAKMAGNPNPVGPPPVAVSTPPAQAKVRALVDTYNNLLAALPR